MTENNETPYVPISVHTIERSPLDLMEIIRKDLSDKVHPLLDANDEKAHVLVSVVKNGVFVGCIIEDKEGNYRFGKITPTSVYEIWQLKQRQYSPEKGAWFSVQFTINRDGLIIKTDYNYDRAVYRAETPENWYVAPEVETEHYQPVWKEEDYREDVVQFPRNNPLPEWLS